MERPEKEMKGTRIEQILQRFKARINRMRQNNEALRSLANNLGSEIPKTANEKRAEPDPSLLGILDFIVDEISDEVEEMERMLRSALELYTIDELKGHPVEH